MQGACFHKGLIYSLEGFTEDKSNPPAIRIIDTENGVQREKWLFEEWGLSVEPDDPRFWSPEDPYLYAFRVVSAEDRVESYFALRTVETKTIGGLPRLCLNGKPYFFHGLLDQGYWPDGIYTPASRGGFIWGLQHDRGHLFF